MLSQMFTTILSHKTVRCSLFMVPPVFDQTVGRSVGPCVSRFLTPKMSCFLYANHQGGPTLTLLNVLGVLGVLNVLNVLNVLHMLDMPMDASLACWALFKTKVNMISTSCHF